MHLKELKKFTVAHGHMNVPAKDKSGKRNKLRNWMIRQRLRYLALPDSYCNNRVMTQAEIDSLNAIGFQWEGLEDRELYVVFYYWSMLVYSYDASILCVGLI